MATAHALAQPVHGLSCVAQPAPVRGLRRAICTTQGALSHMRISLRAGELPRLPTLTNGTRQLLLRS